MGFRHFRPDLAHCGTLGILTVFFFFYSTSDTKAGQEGCCSSAACSRFLCSLWLCTAVCSTMRPPLRSIGFLFRGLLMMIMKMMVVGDLTAQADHRLYFCTDRIWSAKKQGDTS